MMKKSTMGDAHASASGGSLLRHHQIRRADKDAAPAPVQREKTGHAHGGGGGSSRRHDDANNDLHLHDEVALKKAAEPSKRNRVLERKPTEDINQRAEAFINKFRHQLLLQRLESIENFEQMLRRGT